MNHLFCRTIISLTFLVVGFIANAQFDSDQFTDSQGTELKYRILYPENYNASEQYPLVLFLHGAGERGDDNVSQLKNGAMKVFEKLQKNHPCIVIAPQCPKDNYWSSVKFERTKYPLDLDFNYDYNEKESLHAAIELVNSFVKSKKADKKRIYITGLSMGGMGTFEAVARYPKLFVAAMPICGGADLSSYGKKQAKVPFYIFHGSVDGVVPVKHSQEAYAKLQELGANVIYKEYPNVNHNSWDNTFGEKDYPGWMFQFTK
ncbi:prolyl oligopeptidase family serine peptidase [Jiulongibacter sediminis]|jgi:predicted peptidase|uniref:carboxylesterase family protein n=1 Tax=Jiulongibacter sediminis TaxID=1605367 RepID=UPI0026ED335A|nr:prolyl oligopeptidase family serine peptidase [Jiulongibacter sediminis]